MNKYRSIAESVRLWMIAVAIAPLVIMALQGYHCAREAVLELKHEQLQVVAQAKEQRIVDWLHERSRELMMLSRFVDLDLHQSPSTNCPIIEAAIESSILVNNSAYESIELYSVDWEPVWGKKSRVHDENLLLPPSFRDELERSDEAILSKPHIHEDGMIGIHIGVRLDAKHYSPARYIIAVLELSSTIYPALAPETSKATAVQSCIVSETGLLLTGLPEGSSSDERVVKLPEALMTIGGKPSVYRNFDREKVVGVATQIDELGWVLITEAKTRHAFMWLHHLKVRALITGLVTLVLIVFLAGKSANRISQPLRYMATTARSIAAGQTKTRMENLAGKEHADVAEAFNQMLDEIERAQSKLIHAAALTAIGELSASIVHEMRNPLSAIKMNQTALQEAVKGNPLYRELLDIATAQSHRLETMLGDLLKYGKLVELKQSKVSVAAFCKEIESCIRITEGSDILFEFHNPSAIEWIYMDPEQMLRALTNLIDNAVQASSSGGVVTLTLRRTASVLVFEVSDAGSGISPRIADKLFIPFFTTKESGTGLGLANVKKIVELHGGSITYSDNEPGALFSIEIPMDGDAG